MDTIGMVVEELPFVKGGLIRSLISFLMWANARQQSISWTG